MSGFLPNSIHPNISTSSHVDATSPLRDVQAEYDFSNEGEPQSFDEALAKCECDAEFIAERSKQLTTSSDKHNAAAVVQKTSDSSVSDSAEPAGVPEVSKVQPALELADGSTSDANLVAPAIVAQQASDQDVGAEADVIGAHDESVLPLDDGQIQRGQTARSVEPSDTSTTVPAQLVSHQSHTKAAQNAPPIVQTQEPAAPVETQSVFNPEFADQSRPNPIPNKLNPVSNERPQLPTSFINDGLDGKNLPQVQSQDSKETTTRSDLPSADDGFSQNRIVTTGDHSDETSSQTKDALPAQPGQDNLTTIAPPAERSPYGFEAAPTRNAPIEDAGSATVANEKAIHSDSSQSIASESVQRSSNLRLHSPPQSAASNQQSNQSYSQQSSTTTSVPQQTEASLSNADNDVSFNPNQKTERAVAPVDEQRHDLARDSALQTGNNSLGSVETQAANRPTQGPILQRAPVDPTQTQLGDADLTIASKQSSAPAPTVASPDLQRGSSASPSVQPTPIDEAAYVTASRASLFVDKSINTNQTASDASEVVDTADAKRTETPTTPRESASATTQQRPAAETNVADIPRAAEQQHGQPNVDPKLPFESWPNATQTRNQTTDGAPLSPGRPALHQNATTTPAAINIASPASLSDPKRNHASPTTEAIQAQQPINVNADENIVQQNDADAPLQPQLDNLARAQNSAETDESLSAIAGQSVVPVPNRTKAAAVPNDGEVDETASEPQTPATEQRVDGMEYSSTSDHDPSQNGRTMQEPAPATSDSSGVAFRVQPDSVAYQAADLPGLNSIGASENSVANALPRIDGAQQVSSTTTSSQSVASTGSLPVVEQVQVAVTEFVRGQVESNDGVITVELQPAELGKLKIQVEQTADSIVTHIIASEASSTTLIREHREELLKALTDLGFDQASVDVSHQESRGERDDLFNRRQRYSAQSNIKNGDEPAATSLPLPSRNHSNGLNIVA